MRDAVDATVRHADEDLDLVHTTAVEELAGSTTDRYRFLVETLLAGLPDPDAPAAT